MAMSCGECGAAFARSEHLQRHRRQHLGLRPFACDTCDASFTRRDTLNRHMLAHDPLKKAGKRRKVAYVSKACVYCAKSKQRCDGGLPCARCSSKQLGCSYTPSRQRGPKSPANPSRLQTTNGGSHLQHSYPDQDTPPLITSSFEPGHDIFPSSAILTAPDVAADTNCVFPAVSMSSSQQGFIPGPLGQPLTATDSCIGDSSFTTQEHSLDIWAWDDVAMPWNPVMSTLLDDESSRILLPMETPLDASDEASNQPDLHLPPSPTASEPAVQTLEFESPTPSFTQTITLSGSGPPKHDDTSPRTRNASRALASNQDPEPWRAEDYGHVPHLTDDTYEAMVASFTRLNCDDECCVRFTNRHLPPIKHMRIYIQVYFEEFHPVFPLLHKATFSPTKDNWVLSLAVSAIGCLFSKALQSGENYSILHEFLRRAIHVQLERTRTLPPGICVAQAAVLNQVGMMFAGDMRFAEIAQTTMGLIATLCRRVAYYFDAPGTQADNHDLASQDWQEWIKKEMKMRLFYCSWLVDCQHSSFWALPTTLPIEFLQFPMPSHESAWDASSQDEWRHNLTSDPASQPPVPLRKRLLDLYRLQAAPSQLGAFNTLLLAMGVYNDAPRLRHTTFYLDLLQQHAQTLPSTSLSRAVVNHIHLASLFLYFPVRELFAFSGWRVARDKRAMIATKLQKWMHNHSEARAALMHACSVWSMIRTRRTAAQHESMGFLLTSIAIWALVELGKRPGLGDLDALPTVRLDGNSEDVKAWARSTEEKRLYLGGVGCLWDQGATGRLIRETIEILEGGIAWPQAKNTAPYLRHYYDLWEDPCKI